MKVLGEPLHELDSTTRKLRQVLDNMEVERIVGVYTHRRKRIVVIQRLFQLFEQRLVIIAILPFVLRFWLLQFGVIIDNAQLFRGLRLLFLL